VRTLRIPRVSRPPKLESFLNGVAREAELTVTDFRQFRPTDSEPVSQPTTAYLSYDDKNLYVAFICEDNPKRIRARLAKHDQIMSDDRTTVNLHTHHDQRRMYWFNVNPYGVQAEGATADGPGSGLTWDTLWYSDLTRRRPLARAACPRGRLAPATRVPQQLPKLQHRGDGDQSRLRLHPQPRLLRGCAPATALQLGFSPDRR